MTNIRSAWTLPLLACAWLLPALAHATPDAVKADPHGAPAAQPATLAQQATAAEGNPDWSGTLERIVSSVVATGR